MAPRSISSPQAFNSPGAINDQSYMAQLVGENWFVRLSRVLILLSSLFLCFIAIISLLLIYLGADKPLFAFIECIMHIAQAVLGFYAALYRSRPALILFGLVCIANFASLFTYLFLYVYKHGTARYDVEPLDSNGLGRYESHIRRQVQNVNWKFPRGCSDSTAGWHSCCPERDPICELSEKLAQYGLVAYDEDKELAAETRAIKTSEQVLIYFYWFVCAYDLLLALVAILLACVVSKKRPAPVQPEQPPYADFSLISFPERQSRSPPQAGRIRSPINTPPSVNLTRSRTLSAVFKSPR